MSTKTKRPPFILSQGMRLLLETDQPRRYLQAQYFRAGRVTRGGGGADQTDAAWADVDRLEVAHDRLTLADGGPCDLSRLVITTDAGVGKTTAMRWLEVELNDGGDRLAVLLTVGELRGAVDDWLDALLPRLRCAAGNAASGLPAEQARRALQLLRAEGRLVLLLDGLDQAAPGGNTVAALRRLLQDPDWQPCRIIVSGRPHALQRYWTELFDGSAGCDWRFVQLDEFDRDQQRRFLGQTADGRARFDLIPAEAGEILSTPRVLEYLHDHVPDAELARIRTAADVYWRSIRHLLKESMRNCPEASGIGRPAGALPGAGVPLGGLHRAMQLLGAIAFQMTATRICRTTADGDGGEDLVPNFDGVRPGDLQRFLDGVYDLLARRPGEGPRSDLDHDMRCLALLNQFLEHGIFDSDVSGLDSILWRNRTLQEFFTAYWLAQFCEDRDAGQLWDWLYLPERPLSEEYYWVWRFLCEMHEDGRDQQAWSRAVEPLFRPGDGTIEGTRRSCELMWRAWPTLERMARRGEGTARAVRDAFWSEFEGTILAGDRGEPARQLARQFCDSFVELPGGEFRMGAPIEKQGMPPDLRGRWKEYLEREGDPSELAAQHLAQFRPGPGKAAQKDYEEQIAWWTAVFQNRDVKAIAQRGYARNETPAEPVQQLDSFLLSRWPTINAWYRLFDPGHGLADSWYRDIYGRISPEAETPAIFVSWYDAWAFCLWARWNGLSCDLPHEHQWEDAAKAGTDWSWNYWWGDEFDAERCNAEGKVGRTTRPDAAHANPWGLEDILGNVWEWTADEYRERYSLDAPPDSSARVLRGGSWDFSAFSARSACRYLILPWDSDSNSGFRVARALQRKP